MDESHSPAERLAEITNHFQRQKLEAAIASGEAIPDSAWIPIPAKWFDPINLSMRPETYWPGGSSLEQRVSRIKGEQRRQFGKSLLRAGELERLEELSDHGFLEEGLSDDDRQMWGSLDPRNLGGEFLPPLGPDVAEIARVIMANATADVESVRASRGGNGITLWVVDEYDTEFETNEHTYEQPLTLKQLIEFIDSAGLADSEESFVGLVIGMVRTSFAAGTEDNRVLEAATASSAFYPDLNRYYVDSVIELVAELKQQKNG